MKNHQRKMGGFAVFEVLFFLLLAAVLVAGAYYVGKNHSNKVNTQSAKTSQGSSTASADSSIPANWKLYADRNLGIKFYYPPDWKVGADPSALEPPVGSDFGNGHKFYGSLDVGADTTASYFPVMTGLVFGKEGITFTDLEKNVKSEWASDHPFKNPRQSETFNLKGGGQGFMHNQVTADYSDIQFYLDVANKYIDWNFREQVVANGGPAENYTDRTGDVIKISHSVQAL